MTGRGPDARLPRPLTAAAALTVVVAVGADLLAGHHTAHVAVLGTVALVLGAVRVRAAGRHRPTFAILSALLVTPPVLDALAAPADPVTAEGSFHHLDADSAVSLTHIALALAVAIAVGAAESLLSGLGAGVRHRLRLLLLPAPAPTGGSTLPPRARPAAALRPGADAPLCTPHRGPPAPAG